ncbi:MAG: SET domain-containing protein-lysine N-methyltransferase [Akkermansiaceae bacterium]|nr:SET domain-containing protein-lysine N-methyltransferase [Akkermansiaceae bacterium]
MANGTTKSAARRAKRKKPAAKTVPKRNTPQKKAAAKRGTSKWVKVGQSGIHNNGLFAIRDIPEDTRIIEYVGDKITKAESERRANAQDEKGRATGDGTVYIFTLNSRYDIDGNVPWNFARNANHSCDPNAHTDIVKGRVWLIASRDIKKGEEVVYDYGFDMSHWEDHPCLCGAKRCLGYIVGEEFRAKMKRKIKARRKKEKKARKKAGK